MVPAHDGQAPQVSAHARAYAQGAARALAITLSHTATAPAFCAVM